MKIKREREEGRESRGEERKQEGENRGGVKLLATLWWRTVFGVGLLSSIPAERWSQAVWFP